MFSNLLLTACTKCQSNNLVPSVTALLSNSVQYCMYFSGSNDCMSYTCKSKCMHLHSQNNWFLFKCIMNNQQTSPHALGNCTYSLPFQGTQWCTPTTLHSSFPLFDRSIQWTELSKFVFSSHFFSLYPKWPATYFLSANIFCNQGMTK